MNSNILIFLYLFLNCDIVVLDISILLHIREESRQIETIGEEHSLWCTANKPPWLFPFTLLDFAVKVYLNTLSPDIFHKGELWTMTHNERNLTELQNIHQRQISQHGVLTYLRSVCPPWLSLISVAVCIWSVLCCL